ncbi:MAG: amidohydrolase family protein, partial [Stenotrophomonas sp.]
MIIDCHGHYTTAPASHDAFRKAQVAHFNDPSLPAPVYPTISDDELRESVDGNQLRL